VTVVTRVQVAVEQQWDFLNALMLMYVRWACEMCLYPRSLLEHFNNCNDVLAGTEGLDCECQSGELPKFLIRFRESIFNTFCASRNQILHFRCCASATILVSGDLYLLSFSQFCLLSLCHFFVFIQRFYLLFSDFYWLSFSDYFVVLIFISCFH
jgi:hypothetical protein